MFILEVNYLTDLSVVDQYLADHRAYLDIYYEQGLLLCSGPKNPRTGGVIVCLFKTRSEVDKFILGDPYTKYNVGKYTVTEFTPVKQHPAIKELCNTSI